MTMMYTVCRVVKKECEENKPWEKEDIHPGPTERVEGRHLTSNSFERERERERERDQACSRGGEQQM